MMFTANEAKAIVAKTFKEFNVSHGKMSARKVSFVDLARGSAYNVTVQDIDWAEWLKAGPKDLKAQLPKGILLDPEFTNVPPHITIV